MHPLIDNRPICDRELLKDSLHANTAYAFFCYAHKGFKGSENNENGKKCT